MGGGTSRRVSSGPQTSPGGEENRRGVTSVTVTRAFTPPILYWCHVDYPGIGGVCHGSVKEPVQESCEVFKVFHSYGSQLRTYLCLVSRLTNVSKTTPNPLYTQVNIRPKTVLLKFESVTGDSYGKYRVDYVLLLSFVRSSGSGDPSSTEIPALHDYLPGRGPWVPTASLPFPNVTKIFFFRLFLVLENIRSPRTSVRHLIKSNHQ